MSNQQLLAMLQWGAFGIPLHAATRHFLVKGSTGSGKSTVLGGLMRSAFHNHENGSDCKGLIFNFKRDMISRLDRLGLGHRVVNLDPLDRRGHPWAIGRDVTTPTTAEAVAHILVPKDPAEQNPFFTEAVANLLIGIMKWFMRKAPGKWTLADVILLIRNLDLTQKLLKTDPFTRHHLDLLKNPETAGNIAATIANKIQPYEAIAACWQHSQNPPISLTEWAESSNHILVLTQDDTVTASLDAINQAIFNRVSQLLLQGPETLTPKTFIILDELPSAGKLDMLKRVMTKGRSKGISITIGLQALEELRHLYDKEIADTIVGMCRHKLILSLDSPESAQWASTVFGDMLVEDVTESRFTSRQSAVADSYAQNRGIQKREAVLASEFLNLPNTNPRQGLTGFYRLGEIACKATLSWDEVTEKLLVAGEGIEDYLPVPESHQWLEPWSERDFQRLGFNPLTLAQTGVTHNPAGLDKLGAELKGMKPGLPRSH